MLKSLTLRSFKNFKDETLPLGPLTILIGTNASGKSNLRDAFRFLHGIARGYSVAEILGEKWAEGGVLQWRGIRGGARETAYYGADTFSFALEASIPSRSGRKYSYLPIKYQIEVDTGKKGSPPRIVSESLRGDSDYFWTIKPPDRNHLKVQYDRGGQKGRYPPSRTFVNSTPVLAQIADDPLTKNPVVKNRSRILLDFLESFRFLDLAPDAMRQPSLPGQTVLGDRGENLSSVLQAICEDPAKKEILVEWIKELTPMDAKGFEFPSDQTGKVLVSLIESNGRHTSAYSASDGTLRFLAMIAALLGPEPARIYFFEEIDNGIHPTRLHLLLQLIEQKVRSNNLYTSGGTVISETSKTIQVIGTTHSPQLLLNLSDKAIEDSVLIYRLPDQQDAHIKRILDIQEARRVLEKQDLAKLHASGWLEDAVAFLDKEEVEG